MEKEKIVIIGGGYAGTISAALLAQLEDTSGNSLYDVTLVERGTHILSEGASLVTGRLHLGGEYPLDEKTALQCLKGATYFAQMMPKEVYTNIPTVSYVVAHETQARKKLSVEEVQKQYAKIQEQYTHYYNTLKKKLGSSINKTLFGKPEALFEPLSEEDLEHINGFAGGIKTREKGLHPVFLGTFLEETLKKHKVTILTSHNVESATKTQNGFTIHTSKGDIEANQVINASWHNAYNLNSKVNPNHTEKHSINAYLRCIAIVDISQCSPKPDAIFGLLDKHGGMYSPFNEHSALLYLPGEAGAYLGETTLHNKKLTVPQTWETAMKEGTKDTKERSKHILNTLKKRYPFLKGARIERLVVRPTLSIDPELEKRRHIDVSNIDPEGNWKNVQPTKATFAPWAAMQVIKKVQERSLEKGTLSKEDLVFKEKTDSIILPKALSLASKVKNLEEKAISYAKARNLPTSMAQQPYIHKTTTTPKGPSYLYQYKAKGVIFLNNEIDYSLMPKGIHFHAQIIEKKRVSVEEWTRYYHAQNNIIEDKPVVTTDQAICMYQAGSVNDLRNGNKGMITANEAKNISDLGLGGTKGFQQEVIQISVGNSSSELLGTGIKENKKHVTNVLRADTELMLFNGIKHYHLPNKIHNIPSVKGQFIGEGNRGIHTMFSQVIKHMKLPIKKGIYIAEGTFVFTQAVGRLFPGADNLKDGIKKQEEFGYEQQSALQKGAVYHMNKPGQFHAKELTISPIDIVLHRNPEAPLKKHASYTPKYISNRIHIDKGEELPQNLLKPTLYNTSTASSIKLRW